MTSNILGRGVTFPLQKNTHGGIKVSQGAAKIRESILMIIGTQHGERVMRPTFGGNLRSLAFASNDAATANLARHYVVEALTTWEPRIILDRVTVDNDSARGCLVIDVQYRIKATHEPQSLVYPFYLEQQ